MCRGVEENGVKKGYWTFYYSNGNPCMSGDFKNGFKDGSWTFYYDNGKQAYVADYANDTMCNRIFIFDTLGRLNRFGRMINNKMNGRWYVIYQSDTLEGSFHFGDVYPELPKVNCKCNESE